MERHPGEFGGADYAQNSSASAQEGLPDEVRNMREASADELDPDLVPLHNLWVNEIGLEDTPELRARLAHEKAADRKLRHEQPELAAKLDQHARDFMAIVDEHYRIQPK